jgi:hypothetical protein
MSCGRKFMNERPKIAYILILLWIALSVIFVMWGVFSLIIVIQIPTWEEIRPVIPQLHFGYLISTIVWFVFSSLFILFSYATFRKDRWVWTTGVIISTIFLVIFSLMLAAFMINAIMFRDWFSIVGLITVVLSLNIDLGIIFYLTRPPIKLYFETT